MKAILFEEKGKNRYAIVLLPSGAIEIEAGDLENIIIEGEGESYSVRPLTSNDLSLLEMIKEVKVDSRLLLEALEYMNNDLTDIGFEDCLFNRMVGPRCSVGLFLMSGFS